MMIDVKNLTLVNDSDIEWDDLGNGIKRKIMTYSDELMLTKVAFEIGAIGTMHSHPHLQISYVSKGKFEVIIGENKKVLEQGDVYFVPSDILHGVVCIEEGELIDVFNPKREDFL
jgi:quercetin dioxygenase-like cupin family protein